jgi:sulfite reductase subunit B
MCSSNKDIYLPVPATVDKVETLTKLETFFSCQLDSGKELGYMPGQFVEVSLPGIGEAPISISSSPTQKGSFEMVIRAVGNVSNALHKLTAGDKLFVRGPFGTSFPVDGVMKGKDVIFICGGIGLIPVRSAIRYVLDNRDDYGRVSILLGAKTPNDRLFVEEHETWRKARNVTILETVDLRDEGWSGPEGVITTLLPLVKMDVDNTIAVVCGPPIMYKFVVIICMEAGLKEDRIYLSLERHMKCGVGKCGHCQINNIYICQDGPVFRFSDVTDLEEAL